ncbi:MAG: hypothetical protein AAGH87_11110 [Pseudomonadota bacterium]
MPHKALIFGHSHAWSLKRAIHAQTYVSSRPDYGVELLLCGTREFPGPLISTGLNGYTAINACLIASLSAHPPSPETWLVSAVQGNYYNIVGMIRPEPNFDFVFPGAPHLPLDNDAELIPYDLVRQIFKDQVEELGLLLKQLPKLGHINIAHINAPPPIESEEFIREDLVGKGALDPQADKISPAALRLKLWLAQKDVIGALCRSLGVACIDAPVETQNERGFLREAFWKDAVHANEQYSAIILRELERSVFSRATANA